MPKVTNHPEYGNLSPILPRFLFQKYFVKMLKFRTGLSINDSEVSKFMKTESIVPIVVREKVPSAKRAIRPLSGPAWTTFERHRSYEAELSATPDIRASEVARGRALIADPNYPSREQLGKIARVLLAGALGR